jgi:hypothetical protein
MRELLAKAAAASEPSKLKRFPLISTHTFGVIAGLVPAIPIIFAAIGTRGNESAFTRVFDALCPRVTAARVAGVVDQFHREPL